MPLSSTPSDEGAGDVGDALGEEGEHDRYEQERPLHEHLHSPLPSYLHHKQPELTKAHPEEPRGDEVFENGGGNDAVALQRESWVGAK